jgi:FkbM family methyltransferase
MFYSQFGEDKILFDIFKGKASGVCVEVGANNGIDDSTSLFFEKLGWKCILVEPNPDLCRKIRETRNALLYEYAASNQSDTRTLYVVEGAVRSDGLSTISTNKEVHDRIKSHGFVYSSVQVHTTTLDRILIDAQINCEIDFISIDVEGHEYEVLYGFSLEKWKPFIILIEDNSNFENDIVSNYLKSFNYVRFMRTGVNDWYAHQTNSRLVNIRSKVRIMLLALKIKSKNRLSRIPLIVKIRNLLKMQGVRLLCLSICFLYVSQHTILDNLLGKPWIVLSQILQKVWR